MKWVLPEASFTNAMGKIDFLTRNVPVRKTTKTALYLGEAEMEPFTMTKSPRDSNHSMSTCVAHVIVAQRGTAVSKQLPRVLGVMPQLVVLQRWTGHSRSGDAASQIDQSGGS